MSIQLEKYQGQKTRFEYPKCGKKRYINTINYKYLKIARHNIFNK